MPKLDVPLAANLPAEWLAMIENAPLAGLDDSPKCATTAARVQRLLDNAPAVRETSTAAAAWLLAGELERSHQISQNLPTPTGFYWHGIMHRREQDFWNAKYWFRKAGAHPILDQLARFLETAQFLKQTTAQTAVALPLVDLSSAAKVALSLAESCERALASQPAQVVHLQQICWLEWQFLFLYGWD